MNVVNNNLTFPLSQEIIKYNENGNKSSFDVEFLLKMLNGLLIKFNYVVKS